MPKTCLILLILLVNTAAFSQFKGRYNQNDTLNVLAISGMNLRQGPSAGSVSVWKIPYGSKVQVVDDSLRQVKFKVEELKGFFIEGYWVKVRFKDQTGYLFDGYLSKFPAIDYKDTTAYEERLDFHFLETNFRAIAKRKALKKFDDCTVTPDNDCFCAFEDKFENGITYLEDFCFEVGSENIIKIRGATMAEVYLFAKAFAQSWQMGIDITYDPGSKVININTTEDGAGCGGIIYLKNGTAIFEWGCSC